MNFLIIICIGISFIIQRILKSKAEKYSNEVNSLNLTGKEIAEKMLKENGIFDVQVIATPGSLTDHYNPLDKTVNLSDIVYQSNSITAAAIASHECGHAVQHATAYSMLTMRSKMVPVVNITNKMMPFIFAGGFLLFNAFPQLMIFAVLIFAVNTLFSFITLPVEFDASDRALVWLQSKGLSEDSYTKSKSALKWAAMTYVISAVTSLVQFLHYLQMFNRRN